MGRGMVRANSGLGSHPEVVKIFNDQAKEIYTRIDRSLAVLMVLQWAAAIMVAWVVAPTTWIGQFNQSQESIYLALVFGGLFAFPPVYLSIVLPGEKLTRYVAAVSQVCFSILFIHLSGGRIETHFHVFVSLAFLAFYKDVGVLLVASAIVIVDHVFRGLYMPISVYGEIGGFEWRWIEHAAWVVFEDIILILGIGRIRQELKDMAISKYELISARENALKVSALKSSFLSNMSHEIRTPLNSIIGFADILRDTDLNGEQRQYVSTIHRCSESLLHLLNDILDFSKIENGLLHLDKHRFDVRELHQDVHDMFQVKCREKGLDLELKMDQEVPRAVVGDSHRLRQILINLVSNAIKFTERGRISVHIKKEKSHYRWIVRDTGVGIRDENMNRLFKVFTQEDNSVTRRYGGTGLGLAITKNLVELMGGDISVESQEGKGTTFTFTLPLEETNS